MKRPAPALLVLYTLCGCGSGKEVVIADLPPPPSERVTSPVPPPAPSPRRSGTQAPDGATGPGVEAAPAGTEPIPEGVDQALVRAWKSSREPGVVFQQTMSMNTGAKGTRTLASRVQVLGDRSRRDDLAEDGSVRQTTLTEPDDVLVIDHAARTWSSLGGRLDKIAKDASSWYFQSEFQGLQRWTRTGTEVVDGILCDVYELGSAGAAGGERVRRTEKVWFARDLDGFALRYESSSFLGLGVTVVRSQVAKAAVPASELKVPAGYTRLAPGR